MSDNDDGQPTGGVTDGVSNLAEEVNMEDNCENTGENEREMETGYQAGGNRPGKRGRDPDENELWTVVGRKGKRFARSQIEDDCTRVSEEIVEICMTHKDPLPKQIGLARLFKSENIQDIIRVKYINAFKVLIQFNKDLSAEKLLNCQNLLEKGYRIQRAMEVSRSYGVIKEIEIDVSEEEVLKSLSSDMDIIGVKRMKRRNTESGLWEPSELIRVCFKSSSLPAYINVLGLRTKVERYMFPVTQCSRCWRYGHLMKTCPSIRVICPKCGEHHANCDKTQFKCVNCNGTHMALAKQCPAFIRERRLREIMSEYNCTYRKALLIYVPPSPPIPKENTYITNNTDAVTSMGSRGKSDRRTYSQVLSQITEATPIPDTYNNAISESLVTCGGDRPTDPHHQRRALSDSDNEGRASQPCAHQQTKDRTKKTKKSKNKPNYFMNWTLTDSESCSTLPEQRENTVEEQIKCETFRELLAKLKEIIFSQRNSKGNKTTKCIKLVCDWLLSCVLKLIAEWPILSFFFKKNGED
ncbi:unnamed protein product [Plutella xylostella]|uniref:(diamondback moth) hypothetical protein n=1 Tax=Plutella xylostella TaxID=51655 RepID=A0A8S4G598_PLUXY|nr:unnamed protein product [Plutella xylostella]